MDPLSIAIGGGIAAVFTLVGRATKRTKRTKLSQPARPICGCTHGLHDHDPATGECHGLIKGDPLKYDSSYPTAWAKIRCTCRQYTGPEKLSTLWVPPVLPSAD